MKDKAIAIIPARYGSTRFPGKVLASLRSKPLIQWIYEVAGKSTLIDRVIVATDDQRIYEAVAGFGGDVTMTSSRARTGSDRCAEVAEGLEEDIIINLQADELLSGPEMLDELIHMLRGDPSIKMATLKKEITSLEELWNRNVVKVVSDNNDCALYFSRSPIPHIRDRIFNPPFPPLEKGGKRGFVGDEDGVPYKTFYKHLGIYAFRRDFLLLFSSLPATRLEELEKLEQLRALESGFKIKVKETGYESYRIDTPEDLEKTTEGTAI